MELEIPKLCILNWGHVLIEILLDLLLTLGLTTWGVCRFSLERGVWRGGLRLCGVLLLLRLLLQLLLLLAIMMHPACLDIWSYGLKMFGLGVWGLGGLAFVICGCSEFVIVDFIIHIFL